METARSMAGLRALGIVALLAAGIVLGATLPTLADADLSLATAGCGTDQPESGELWAAPPEQGRPGEPY